MFIRIAIALGPTRYSNDRQAEISLEGDLDTLAGMAYGAGDTVFGAISKLIDAEQQAQQRLLAEAETAEEE